MPVIEITTTSKVIFEKNINRVKLFLQNVGEEKIYCTKQKNGTVREPSPTDYDFMLVPIDEAGESGKVKEASSVSQIEICSIGGIKAICEEDTSKLAYFETEKVSL